MSQRELLLRVIYVGFAKPLTCLVTVSLRTSRFAIERVGLDMIHVPEPTIQVQSTQ
jgi:hypothetical protein